MIGLNLAPMKMFGKSLFNLLLPLLAATACLLATQSFAGDVIVDPVHEYRDEMERGEFSYDDSQDIPWIENETEVLAVPRPEDLTKVSLDQMPPKITLLVDKSRITVNADDRVVRVWLWTRSDSGLEKGSFEGYRCDTREYKIYAWANPDAEPSVSKVKRPVWRTAKKRRAGNYRTELLNNYFCGVGEIRNARQIADSLTGELQGGIFDTR